MGSEVLIVNSATKKELTISQQVKVGDVDSAGRQARLILYDLSFVYHHLTRFDATQHFDDLHSFLHRTYEVHLVPRKDADLHLLRVACAYARRHLGPVKVGRKYYPSVVAGMLEVLASLDRAIFFGDSHRPLVDGAFGDAEQRFAKQPTPGLVKVFAMLVAKHCQQIGCGLSPLEKDRHLSWGWSKADMDQLMASESFRKALAAYHPNELLELHRRHLRGWRADKLKAELSIELVTAAVDRVTIPALLPEPETDPPISTVDLDAKGVQLLLQNPTLPTKELVNELGLTSRTCLYRLPMTSKALKERKAKHRSLPRGVKTRNGDLEAEAL